VRQIHPGAIRCQASAIKGGLSIKYNYTLNTIKMISLEPTVQCYLSIVKTSEAKFLRVRSKGLCK
jgi:hypothetical protein